MKPLLALLFCIFPLSARADPPRVVTDIAPIHGLAARLMQGAGSPDLIVPLGASPHEYALRPSQARALQEAELVIWVGPALTPWLARVIDTLSMQAQVIPLLELPETHLVPARDIAAFDHDDHDHDEAHAPDPHAWLNPDNARAWNALLAQALAVLDPENAALYAANAAAARLEIDAAEAQARSILAPVADRDFIVFHDAFHYFEDHFGLRATNTVALSDATAPGAARVRDLQSLIRDRDISCVFVEPRSATGLIQTLIEGTEAKKAVLDPLGVSADGAAVSYPDLIMSLSRTMADCLAP